MFLKAGDEDTICALSTPPGQGGIAVVRVSGEKAGLLTRRMCSFLPEKPESHRLYFGTIKTLDHQEPIDEVLVSFFAHGRSFTGEETTEISCHGGHVLVSSILKELVKAGCRMAKPGEFTYRAFMNGRLDLVQAESVLGLIESQSRQSAKVSLRQLQGHLSNEFRRVEDDLLWILAQLEASIDFSAEDIEVVPSLTLTGRTTALMSFVEKLIGSYTQGRILRDGVQIALVGRPNAGKSSLLNALVQEDRAIVTEHAGTTRDLIEGRISIAGLPVTFVDTAGLRETDNAIERIGIERSKSAMERSDYTFFVIDLSDPSWMADLKDFASRTSPQKHFVFNKIDLDGRGEFVHQAEIALAEFGQAGRGFYVSALTGSGLKDIETMLEKAVQSFDSEATNMVTQARHMELLQKIHSCLNQALRLIKDDSSPEFIAFELQDAIRAIHELLGKEFHEQVIDRIFKEFCLGK